MLISCLGLFVIGAGAVMLLNRDMMWGFTQWSNAAKGIVNSERTESWELSNAFGAVLIIIIGIGMLVAGFALEDDLNDTQDSLESMNAFSTSYAVSNLTAAFNSTQRALTPSPTPRPDEIGRVTRVIDGDTIEVSINDQLQRVRYLGINAPSLDDECGEEAAAANRELVEGETVWLYRDVSDQDQDERLLRYVYVDDLFINTELVKQGFANAVNVPPDNQYAALLENLMRDAQRDELGCAG